MTLILFPNGKTYLYDCNATDDNAPGVLRHFKTATGPRNSVDVLV